MINRRAVLCGVVAGASGCSPLALLNSITPAGPYELHADLAYGSHPRQRLDLYHANAPGAALVFFYGGNWRPGFKGDYRFVAESLTRLGLTVAIPDCRLYPQARFPVFVEDGAHAVAFAHKVLPDVSRIYVAGHSSGAHIAALLALDRRYLWALGLEASNLAGFIGIAGPYDFLPFTSEHTARVFAGTADLDLTQPITFASRDAPPSLLVHGTTDQTVLPRNSRNLAARLEQQGATTRLKMYPHVEHVEILLGLSSTLRGNSPLLTDIHEFVSA